jgi:hypothetical protein
MVANSTWLGGLGTSNQLTDEMSHFSDVKKDHI